MYQRLPAWYGLPETEGRVAMEIEIRKVEPVKSTSILDDRDS